MSKYKKLGDVDYLQAYRECYDELSPQGKRECERSVRAMRSIITARGLGENGAKELLFALIAKGFV